jgi:hypothetical protein
MAQSPILEPPVWVEKRAGRIADPVERLRFLRRQMRGQHQSPVMVRVARTHLASLVMGLVAMVAIVPLPIGTAETFAKEQGLVAGRSLEARIPSPASRVWLVERSNSLEVYSNGLRIDLKFSVSNRPRAPFPIFSLGRATQPISVGNAPVGIVYHTTESNLAPFEEEENRHLQRIGRNLIEYIAHDRSYHYVIDRFGRVFRVVEEADAANHAGMSIWGDGAGIYVNLNDSFLGVSFEGQTGAVDEVTPAQVAAGRVLT